MRWEPGMKVVHRAQRGWGVGLVIQVADEGRRLAVRFAGRDGVTIVSGRDPALVAVPSDTPIEEVRVAGPLEALAAGRAGPASAFRLRSRVARLESLRRADSLGALLSSRVHVLPHQVGAAGRILADRAPRFVLADEVGLGKTIEAGLVFAGLRQLGLAERVLAIVPEHLAFQWLAELFHKFNALFTLLTPERIAELGGPAAALVRSPLAILPLERLRDDPDLVDAACEVALDLTIVDEAHHLADDRLFRAVEPIARSSVGLLLLTATPVRLDPREYFRLLSLVEPIPSASLDAFLARLERHDEHAAVARSLLSGGDPVEARRRLAELEPDDPSFAANGQVERGALLSRLADRYSLSSRLIRNRRASVGAFTARVLRREEVPREGKVEAVADACSRLAGAGEKVLAFGADAEALRALQAAIARRGREALLYDDAETIEARDRLVARFRDPDGPMVLLSGESGGEGRNFQFACHLVCLDLPESPLTLEQRIGRLDRLGQHRPVEIHAFPSPGEETFLADLYEHVIGIFEEPVGGLDAVLASLPAELAALRAQPAGAREAFRRDLEARVAAARRAQRDGDPILDLRSASLPELSALVANAFRRLGEPPPASFADSEAGGMEVALVALSRALEEELEEVCVEVARRVGVDVDTDQNVQPFEVAFTLGSHLRVEALPGMAIPDEPVTELGSFWRETAVGRDELEWFATGHKLVEALVGLVRDGDAGRSAALSAPRAPPEGALYTRWHVVWPAAADVDPGARVPARQAARYLEGRPIALLVDLGDERQVLSSPVEEVEDGGDSVAVRAGHPSARSDRARADGSAINAGALVEAARVAEREAAAELSRRREEALRQLSELGRAEEERLALAGAAGGAGREAVDAALAELRRHGRALEAALSRARLELDAAALVLPR
jgi:ATP-dependent helicase HepA